MVQLPDDTSLKLIREHENYPVPCVCCPVCGDFYSHIIQASTLVGRDKWEAQIYKGTFPQGHTSERRSALAIVFAGECGHTWELHFQQHKGANEIELYLVEDDDASSHS